jgi:hypothetical protein
MLPDCCMFYLGCKLCRVEPDVWWSDYVGSYVELYMSGGNVIEPDVRHDCLTGTAGTAGTAGQHGTGMQRDD